MLRNLEISSVDATTYRRLPRNFFYVGHFEEIVDCVFTVLAMSVQKRFCDKKAARNSYGHRCCRVECPKSNVNTAANVTSVNFPNNTEVLSLRNIALLDLVNKR